MITNGGSPGAPSPPPGSSPEVRRERLFLALCVAVPDEGEVALAGLDVEAMLTSTAMRAAARQLAGRLRTPLADLPRDDEALARTVADIVAQAGRVPDPSGDRLRYTRLGLEQDRLDRAIRRARSDGVGSTDLAAERERVLEARRAIDVGG